MPIVGFLPFTGENAFCQLWVEDAKLAGAEVVDLEDPGVHIEDVDVAILSWFDEISARNPARSYALACRKRNYIDELRANGIKIATAVHNRVPHRYCSPRQFASTRRYVLKHSDAVIVLCDETKEVLREQLGKTIWDDLRGRVVKIPLPSYNGVYHDGGQWSREKLDIDNKSMVLLAFGAIKPYKNIELIFELARDFQRKGLPATFVIAGKSSPISYGEELACAATELGNVKLIQEFIPDDDVKSLIDLSDILLTPLDKESSLNSSACVLAFSYGRSVIAPDIGTIKEYPAGTAYNYEYEDAREHYQALLEATLRAERDFENGKLQMVGSNAYRESALRNGPDAVSNAFERMFEMLGVS